MQAIGQIGSAAGYKAWVDSIRDTLEDRTLRGSLPSERKVRELFDGGGAKYSLVKSIFDAINLQRTKMKMPLRNGDFIVENEWVVVSLQGALQSAGVRLGGTEAAKVALAEKAQLSLEAIENMIKKVRKDKATCQKVAEAAWDLFGKKLQISNDPEIGCKNGKKIRFFKGK